MEINLVAFGRLSEKIGELLIPEMKISIPIKGKNRQIKVKEIDDPLNDPIIKTKDGWITEIKASVVIKNTNGAQWLYLKKESDTHFINIGKYYTCKLNKKKISFWIGAESMKEEGTYIRLYIDKDQVKEMKSPINTQTQPPEKILICGKKVEKGTYLIKVDDFSFVQKSDYERRSILHKELQRFLTDIFC